MVGGDGGFGGDSRVIVFRIVTVFRIVIVVYGFGGLKSNRLER